MMLDQQDPSNGGDWWSTNVPPASGTTSLADAVGQIYLTALGRAASPQEIQDQITGGSGDLATIQQSIYASPEAQAYSKSRQQAPTPNQTGIDPNAPGPTTGGATPAPTAVPQGLPDTGFGAKPPIYQSDPNAPVYTPLPTYVPPTWTGGDYQNPTLEDLQNSPGYAAGLAADQQARQRSAAAQGTVLNGGTEKALGRAAQDYATTGYQQLRDNTYQAYVEKYNQFQDAAGMDLNARTLNANNNQNTFANNLNTYTSGNARTLSDYLTNVTTNRNAELDYWNRLQDVNQTGANLAGASR